MSFEIKRARGKTTVFSGTRHHSGQVPRLEDLCIQKLFNNANKIECVGDVPYYILRPLLTKLSLPQLRRIESYNPHIVAEPESDEPWRVHCQSLFEGRQPHNNETWRDLFRRCERERDSKIEKIAKRIKKHEERAVPARQTRIVDTQLPGGKNRAVSSSTVITRVIKNRVPSSTGNNRPSTSSTVVITRETANGSGTRTKAKAAPLMQKSMQLFKSRFRR